MMCAVNNCITNPITNPNPIFQELVETNTELQGEWIISIRLMSHKHTYHDSKGINVSPYFVC